MIESVKVRGQDVVLAMALAILVWLAHTASERAFIAAVAVLQLTEGRVFQSFRWARSVSVVLQLAIIWVLIGITNGVESHYYLLLLLPMITSASSSGLTGALAVSVAGVGTYLSFLLYIDYNNMVVGPEARHILAIRCLMLAAAATTVSSLASLIRSQAAQYKLTAEQLAAANKSLTEAEAAVRRSERLAALGQLSAGLAHELRNPLGSIKGSAELLARTSQDAAPVTKELAQIISSEVDRTNSLVTRFLNFARPLEPRREVVDVREVIDRAVGRTDAQVIREYSNSLPRLAIDPELMEQVFLNLVTNAAQASNPGDPVRIRTRELNGQAEVSVIDHGCGIPQEKLETIFNPFVTTKKNGVGLGLAIVAKIVDGHGGKMAVESEPGRGSTFRVLLPLSSN